MTMRLKIAERDDSQLVCIDNDSGELCALIRNTSETIRAATPEKLIARLDELGISRERLVVSGPYDGDRALSDSMYRRFAMLLW